MSQILEKPEVGTPGVGTGRWMVTIFNDDHTPVDLVIFALLRATGCTYREAEMEVWEAEKFGKAPVHFADKNECDAAATIIGSIGVKTEVTPEWND